ncbi:MAG: hypothetical protein ACE5EH_07985 [Gammaproteobacteria bacterium]
MIDKTAIVFGTGIVALSAIRAYARTGVSVVHVSTKLDDIAGCSRFISEKVVVSVANNAEQSIIEFLVNNGERWDGALLDPVNDPYMVLISKHFELLSKYYVVAVQRWDLLKNLVEKDRLYVHANHVNVPVPRIIHIKSGDELSDDEQEMELPCIVKPTQTPKFFSVYGQKVLVAKNADQLKDLVNDALGHELDIMVSSIIEGPDTNLFIYISYLDDSGNIMGEVCVQKLRQHPSSFGVGSVVRSVPMIDEIKQYSQTILDRLQYRGFSAAEFKLDEKTSDYKLVEINTRSVLYEQLFTKCGVNFKEIMVKSKLLKQKIKIDNYEAGVTWIQNFSEVFEVKRYLRRNPGSILDFFRVYRRPWVFAIPVLDDPGPFIKMFKKQIVPGILRKLSRVFGESRDNQSA